MRTR
jgi:hypothetical protein